LKEGEGGREEGRGREGEGEAKNEGTRKNTEYN